MQLYTDIYRPVHATICRKYQLPSHRERQRDERRCGERWHGYYILLIAILICLPLRQQLTQLVHCELAAKYDRGVWSHLDLPSGASRSRRLPLATAAVRPVY